MPSPKSFAGFKSPHLIVRDRCLTAPQKRSALLHWRAAALRNASHRTVNSQRQAELLQDIKKALELLESQSELTGKTSRNRA